jgi:hypothetical protein
LGKMDATPGRPAGRHLVWTSRPPLADDTNPYCYSPVMARLLMGYSLLTSGLSGTDPANFRAAGPFSLSEG